MKQTADAIVIGAGVIGAATAFELAKTGRDVVVVDQLPASGYGSTSSSSAIVRCQYSTVAGSSLAWESYHVWRQWAHHVGGYDERGLAEFREIGCLAIKDAANEFLAPVCNVMDHVGIPYAHWDNEAIAARLPGFDLHRYGPPKRADHPDFGIASAEFIAGGVYFPNAGYVNDPQLAAHNLQRAAEHAGAEFRFNVKVTAIRREADSVRGVSLADGSDIAAPVVVNVGGPHSRLINDMAGVSGGMNVTSRALRKEVCYLPAPTGCGYDDTAPFFTDPDTGAYCRPESGGKIVTGSLEPDCDALVWVGDVDDFDRAFSDQWTTQAMRLGMRIPTLGIPGQATGVVDLYDVSDDWIPIYDRADLDGFFMACGTSGNQFKNAPVAGAIMVALIEAAARGRDHDAEPLQFELPQTNATLDLAAFSRRRDVNKDSSFSVLG